MVKPVHHATAKAANKAGISITGEAAHEVYTVIWPEANKRFVCEDPAVGLADMRIWQMLSLEYPKLKVAFKDGRFTLKQGRTLLADDETLTACWDAYCEQQGESDEGSNDQVENGEDHEDEEKETRSIVKPVFRARYKPHSHTCGDELTGELREYLQVEDKEGNVAIDAAKLKRFAKANGCWVDTYAALNNGQVRMNVGNRIRAKLRKEEGFEVSWPR